jgi:hypothetical protein
MFVAFIDDDNERLDMTSVMYFCIHKFAPLRFFF